MPNHFDRSNGLKFKQLHRDPPHASEWKTNKQKKVNDSYSHGINAHIIQKDIRNATPAEMLINCQKLFFQYVKNKIDMFC